MKFKRISSSLLALIIVVSVASPAAASQDLAPSFSGGPVIGNSVMKPKGSPYIITSPIDIPEGATLTVAPGVEIVDMTQPVFRVQGSLKISGTRESPVLIKVSRSLIQTIKTSSGMAPNSIDISFAHIEGGGNFKVESRFFSLTDSDLVRQSSCSLGENEIWISSQSSKISRNYFSSICGFSFVVNFGVFGPRGTFFVESNHFQGNPKTDSWLQISALRQDTMTIVKNTFASATSRVIESGFFKTSVFANENFWGSLQLAEVRKLVEGSIPDTFSPALVTLNTVLSAPDDLTPITERFFRAAAPGLTPKAGSGSDRSTSTSIPPRRYPSCPSLNRVYPGGVAKSTSSSNQGPETKEDPFVSPRLYKLNRSLDRDKDGIACER